MNHTQSQTSVLIIDDDQDLLVTMEMQLRLKGYGVQTASDGTSGINLASTTAPEIVLLDIGLPDIEGLEVVRLFRAQFNTACCGIIMLTARSDQDAMREAVAAGADDYVLKPYDIDELTSRIEMVKERTARNLERNPLTGLPGNHVIQTELQRRVDRQIPFALGYVDIDHFKSFNDRYGPEAGDRMIGILSKVLVEAVQLRGDTSDFIGHIGGDDFVFLVTPERTLAICETLFERFADEIASLYDPEDIEQGGIRAKGRDGVVRLYAPCTLSVGVASSNTEKIEKTQRAFEMATQAKHRAKSHIGDYCDIWGQTQKFTAPLASGRILIIEDDPDLSYSVATGLEGLGYECKAVGNVGAAREAIAAFDPDLLLIDIGLKGTQNGTELIAGLRKDTVTMDLPIIIVSALEPPRDRPIGSRMGADAFIGKPFELDQVARSIGQLLQSPEGQANA